MKLPRQSVPVHRPDLIQPYQLVDVVNGTVGELISIRVNLTHALNPNDPQAWALPTFNHMQLSAGRWSR